MAEPPRVRVRQRPAPVEEAPKARVRVRPATPSGAPAPAHEVAKTNSQKFRTRYTADEAVSLCGSEEDPVARGVYSTSAMITVSVASPGRGDNNAGKLWRIDDTSFRVWGMQVNGSLRYLGVMTGTMTAVMEKLLARCRPVAMMRSKQQNPVKLYEEWRGPCAPKKKAA